MKKENKIYKRKTAIMQVYFKALFSDYTIWALVVSLIGSAVGTVASVIEKMQSAIIVIIALIVSSLILVIKAFISIRSAVLDTKAYFYLQDLNDEYSKKLVNNIINHLNDDGNNYRYVGYDNTEHLYYSDEVNNRIRNNEISINVPIAKYSLSKDLQSLVPFVLMEKLKNKKTFTNDKKVTLASDIYVGTTSVSLMESRYYDGELTNELALKRIRSRRHHYFKFNGSDLFLDDDLCHIKSLSNNALANRIGSSTLAITSDNYLVIGVQGKNNLHNAGKYVPTGSGSMDYDDLLDANNLNRFIIKGTERELEEESSAGSFIDKTIVVGYGRLIERGAKPEFFCITYLKESKDQILYNFERNNKEIDIKLVERLHFVKVNEYEKFLKDNHNNISVGLFMYKNFISFFTR